MGQQPGERYGDRLERDAQTFDQLTEVGQDLIAIGEKLNETGDADKVFGMIKNTLEKFQLVAERFAPESCEAMVDPAEDGCPPVGRVLMGGLAVSLTRSTADGVLSLLVENEREIPTDLRIRLSTGHDLWKGEIE